MDEVVPTERIAEVRRRMEEIGLPGELFDVYVVLSRLGISKAATIAKEVGTSRPDAYRRLDRLSEDGYVGRILGRPARYTARDPVTLFRVIERRLEKQVARVAQVRDQVLDDLQALHRGDKIRPTGNTIRMIEGGLRIQQKLDEWVGQARRSLDLVSTTPQGWIGDDPTGSGRSTTWNRLQDRIEAGVQVRILLAEGTDTVTQFRFPTALQERVRRVQSDRPLRFVVRDGRHLLAVVASTATGGHEEQDVAMITDAPGLIDSHHALVDGLWRAGEPLAAADVAVGRM